MVMSEKSDINQVHEAGNYDSTDQGLQGTGNTGAQTKLEAYEVKVSDRHHSNMVIAIWILAVFTAFLFGSTIVNIVVTKWSYERSKRQVEAISTLAESVKEVQKSIAELSRLIKELPEMQQQEEEEPYQSSDIEQEKV